MIYKCKQKAAFGDKNTKGISNIQQFIPETKKKHFFSKAPAKSQSAKPSIKYIRHLA